MRIRRTLLHGLALTCIAALRPVSGASRAVELVQLSTIATSSRSVLTQPTGLDSDHDAQGEFVFKQQAMGPGWTARFEFHESTGLNSFHLAHVLDISTAGTSSYYVGDSGDSDQDGRSELVVYGRTSADYFIRVYESNSLTSFPTDLVWQWQNGAGWPEGVRIADSDGDGALELVTGGRTTGSVSRLVVHESVADNAYAQTYYQAFPSMYLPQSIEVTDDLDADGRREILFAGLVEDAGFQTARVFGIEAAGNNQYVPAWSVELSYDGTFVNPEFIVSAGDLDGDGLREFVVGGIKPNVVPSSDYDAVLFVLEMVGDDEVSIVTTIVESASADGASSAAIADVDGDGAREVIFGTGAAVHVYASAGDDSWQQVWSTSSPNNYSVAAGDHDNDGMAELVVQHTNGTRIWEIDPVFAADGDVDGIADASDNCPDMANATQSDEDDDHVGDVCDNCGSVSNPDQGPAPLGQTTRWVSRDTLTWAQALDVVFVRGPLTTVAGYSVDLGDELAQASGLSDPTIPTPNNGYFYLIRPDCPAGSWQSSPGAEPGRDIILP